MDTVFSKAIDYKGSANLTKIQGGASGQKIYLYSTNGKVLEDSTSNKIILKDRKAVTLNRYIPVVLQNINGLWTQIG